MQTLIPIDDYRRPETLELERQTIFRRLWQFAGFARDVAAHYGALAREVS